MKAIILSAGQGSRLLPLTNETPKCLLPVGNRSVLQWQVEAISRHGGFEEIVVVTGFRAHKIEDALAEMGTLQTKIRTVFNPFFKVADNLASCWMVREAMEDDFLIINGDSLFEARILSCLLYTSPSPRDRQKSRMPSSA